MSWEEYKAKREGNPQTISTTNSTTTSSWEEYKKRREKAREEEEERRRVEQEKQKNNIVSSTNNTNNFTTKINTSNIEELQKEYDKLPITEQAEFAKQIQEKEKSKTGLEKIAESSNEFNNTPLYSKETIEENNGKLNTYKKPNDITSIASNVLQGAKKGIMNFMEAGVSAVDNKWYNNDDLQQKLQKQGNELREESGKEPLEIKTTEDLYKEILGDSYNKDLFGRDKEKQKEKWNKTKQNINTKIALNIENTSSPVGRKLAELAPSIGQQLPGYVMPGNLGLTYFTGSAKGSYTEDAQQRGMTENASNIYSGLMATFEGLTDMIGAKLAKGVGGKILKNNAKDALKLFGLDVAENFLEEAVMEPLSEITATLTGGKETADWNNMWNRMLNSGIDGALSSIIMSGASAGLGKAIQVTNKISNNQQVTMQEVSEAVRETLQSNKVNQEQLKNTIKENTNNIINQNTQALQNNMDINVENAPQSLYNNNESESGLNGERGKTQGNQEILGQYDTRIQQESEQQESKKYTRTESEQTTNNQKNLKQNIINQKVLEYIKNNKENFETNINIDTNIINKSNPDVLDYKKQHQGTIYNKAKELFADIHRRVFKNNNQNIYVTNADIKESIEKTLKNPEQKKYINENIAVFSQLDKVIENAELISSDSIDNKGRTEYQNYEYYVSKANIDGKPYIVEFDTRLQKGSTGKQERHFRLERIYNINEAISQTGTDNSINQIGSDIAFINNSIPSSNENVNYTNKYAQQAKNDTQNNQNVAPSVANNSLPVGEYTRKKTMNPTEIANLKKQDANTTPQLSKKTYKTGNKQSSFLSNIITDSKFLNEDLRQQMSKEDNIRYYEGITNEKTLEKAYNKLQEDGQDEVIKWHSKDSKNATAEDVAEGWILLKQYQDNGDYQSAVEVAKKMRDIGTTAGQTVQAYNILSRLTPEGMFYYAQSELNEAYNKMVDGKSKKWIEENQSKFDLTPEETQNILDIMKDVSTMEDGYDKKVKIAEVQKIITDKIPASTGQSIKAWMRISMLFNPKTQVRNVMGNAVIMPVNMFSDSVSAGIDKLIAKKTGVRTTGNINIKNYGKGFGKGLYESYNDFRKGINTRNIEGNRFEVSEGKSFNNKGIGKALNRVDNLLSFMLDAGDRGFYEATFTNSLNNQMVLNNTTTPTQQMIDIATNEALQRTWQDNNKYTQSVLKIRNILNNVNVKGYGLGDVIIPFAKTPANLTKAIVDYSPAGLVKTLTLDARKFKNSLENGQYSPQLQHQFVQNLGKATAGTFLYVLSYGLAKAGVATGEADDDKDVKNFMKNSLGISSYSIKIGDKSFTYDWAQPIATPLAIMTNYVKYSKENPDANAIEKAINAMNIGTEQLLQQSFMESLNTVLNGNGTTLENLSQAILELPARAIPTFSKQIADMVDGTQRTSFEYDRPVKSAINSVIAKIPIASKSLPASVDTLGNEIKKYGGNNNLWNVMFNPANTNKGNLSKAGEEIYKVYKETGDTTIFPRTAPYYINNKNEKVTMTAEQRSKFQTISGKYVENSLTALLNDKDYKKLSSEEKAKIINEIVSDSYSKAKYEVLEIDSNEYEKLRTTLENVKPSTYYSYKFKTTNLKKDNEKIDVLLNSNYTNKEKTALYEQYILSSSDKQYPIIKEAFTDSGLNIQKYLEYKNQEFSADKKDDGTVEGSTISGSKKTKVWNYIENMNITYTQKLLLYGLEYTPSDSQQQQIINYVKSLPNKTNKEKLEILSQFKGFTIYKDGTVKY